MAHFGTAGSALTLSFYLMTQLCAESYLMAGMPVVFIDRCRVATWTWNVTISPVFTTCTPALHSWAKKMQILVILVYKIVAFVVVVVCF